MLYFFKNTPKMFYTLEPPASLRTRVTLPASKSLSNRALVINALAHSKVVPENLSDCDDTFVMKRALATPSELTDIMAAGTAMRFLTAYYAVTPGRTILTGTARMRRRPIKILVDALRQIGADIRYNGEEGYPPLRITGRQLEGGSVELSGSVSSQFTSALLMVGPVLEKGLHLKLTGNIVSIPYINMTLRLMRHFGAQAGWDGDRELFVEPGGYRPAPLTIENDWSAASYWYEMVALSPDEGARVELPGLFAESAQGDSEVRRLFVPLGVKTEMTTEGAVLTKGAVSDGEYEANLEQQPDLAQTVVATCALLGKPFKIKGLQSLRIKETDRLKALQNELGKLNFSIRESGGSILSWNGKKNSTQPQLAIDTYDDHRMAMALAPAAFRYRGIRINNPQVVSKSYPRFWQDLKAAGFKIEDQ